MILENLGGAFQISWAFKTPFLRWRRTRWGAEAADLSSEKPGDDIISEPRWQYTMAVTIRAGAARVWPWIVQIGQGRGGFYSYQGLENLAGCKIQNTDRILPEFQHLSVGEGISLHPGMPLLPVAAVEEDRYLVIGGTDANERGEYYGSTWDFILEEHDDYTRLIARARYTYDNSFKLRLSFGPLFLEPISTVMQKKMLKEIKRLAEAGNKLYNEEA